MKKRPFKSKQVMEWPLVGLTLVLFAVASNTQSGWLLVMVALMLAAIIWGALWPRWQIRSLQLERQLLDQPARAGQPFTINYILHNRSSQALRTIVVEDNWDLPWLRLAAPLPQWGAQSATRLSSTSRSFLNFLAKMGIDLRLKDDPAPTWHRVRFYVAEVPAHSQVTLSCRALASQRRSQILPAPILSLASGLGLFRFSISCPQSGNPAQLLSVQPAVLPLTSQSRQPSPSLLSPTYRKWQGQSDNLYGLHAYQEGEDVRRVHWMTSARLGELMLQDFYDPGGHTSLLVLCNVAPWPRPQLKEDEELAVFGLEEALLLIASALAHAQSQHKQLGLLCQHRGQIVYLPQINQSWPWLLTELSWEEEASWQWEAFWSQARMAKKRGRLQESLLLSLTPRLNLEELRRSLPKPRCLLFDPSSSALFKASEAESLKAEFQATLQELRNLGLKAALINPQTSPLQVAQRWL